MKRKKILILHLAATAIATITIISFFTSSLIAEISGDEEWIKMAKATIFRLLPILLFTMPALAISGNKLAANSSHPKVVQKKRRMKFVMINGIILAALAVFLYYRANYQTIDGVFLIAQLAEFAFGLGNMILISLNIKAGMQLSGRLKINRKEHGKAIG